MRSKLPFQHVRIYNSEKVTNYPVTINWLKDINISFKKKYLPIAIYFILSSIILAGFTPSSSVSAVSDYDNTITNTGSVFSTCYGNSPYTNLDLTQDWSRYLTTDSMYGNVHIGGDTGSSRTSFLDEFNTKLNAGTGWGVSQLLDSSPGTHDFGSIRVYLTNSVPYFTTIGGVNTLQVAMVNMATIQCVDNTHVNVYYNNSNVTREIATEEPAGTWFKPYFWNGAEIDYDEENYEGAFVADGLADIDDDGLTFAKETAQGTSDTNSDTDSDGINDLKESRWFEDRNSVFCDTSTPKNCTYPDPLKKDIFVQIDWLKDSNNTIFKPSVTQIELVEDMFNEHNITLHADTGQYGGGEELSVNSGTLKRTSTSSVIDFFDFRDGGDGVTKKISTDRENIWRYMISGYNFQESPLSSGWAQTMSDILYISQGLIENDPYVVDSDRAIASTIAHELGHSICLSKQRDWDEQPEECVFAGVDSYFSEDYESVMNYTFNLTHPNDLGVVSLSEGSNGSNDHDDWSATQLGLSRFNGIHSVYEE